MSKEEDNYASQWDEQKEKLNNFYPFTHKDRALLDVVVFIMDYIKPGGELEEMVLEKLMNHYEQDHSE